MRSLFTSFAKFFVMNVADLRELKRSRANRNSASDDRLVLHLLPLRGTDAWLFVHDVQIVISFSRAGNNSVRG